MTQQTFQWTVIGAGPAGIAAVGKLLDHGISPQKIAWIDPEFAVGDFGTKWLKVSSNTKVGLFLKFFENCQAFKYSKAPHFEIQKADPTKTCLLHLAAAPLQWITDHLKNTVSTFKEKAQSLQFENNFWKIKSSNIILETENIIFAPGAEPKSLKFPNVTEIPLPIALDPDKLNAICNPEETIAVFGSSHSAIVALENLLDKCTIKKVINFYLLPLRYAIYYDDWILFDDTGLKGRAAEWARAHIDEQLHKRLERVISTEENTRALLPLCSKAIYATGFQRRSIEGLPSSSYNEETGIIAPGLFGLGIAYPEAKIDRHGNLEHRVGLWKFMDYLNRVMPFWLNLKKPTNFSLR